jgi:N6-L-threonylcarbamoyladenine synthase
MTEEILRNENVVPEDIGGIAVTYGPGLLCSLLIGLNFAKGLSFSLGIPFVGVNHLEAHIYSPFITKDEFTSPFLSLLVSGGHTSIIMVNGFRDYEVLGSTLDDACGESFDKVSKLIGLGYPGGPEIQRFAREGDENAFDFPVPDPKGLDFSYSGLKTSVLYTYRDMSQQDKICRMADIAASFQKAAVQSLILKVKRAVKLTNINRISISGGVSANKLLRESLDKLDVDWVAPDSEFTVDNGAMVGSLGYRMLKEGIRSDYRLKANPRLFL